MFQAKEIPGDDRAHAEAVRAGRSAELSGGIVHAFDSETNDPLPTTMNRT